MNSLKTCLTIALLFGIGATGFCAAPDEVVPVTEIFTHMEADNFGGMPVDVITGTGLDDTDINTIPASWPTNHPSEWRAVNDAYNDEWQSNKLLDKATSINAKIGWAIFDLGEVKNLLSELYVWNVRESGGARGTQSNNIYYALSPSVAPSHSTTSKTGTPSDYDFASGGWTKLNTSGVLVFNQKATKPTPAETIVSLEGISARYIGVEILSNYGDLSRVGLSEVGITVTPPPAGTIFIIN